MSALGFFSLRRCITVVVLIAAWCAMWGSITVANVLSGFVVGTLVSVPVIGTPGLGGVRLKPLSKFAWLVTKDLVASTFSVAYEVATPTDYTDEAIVRVDLPGNSKSHMLLIVVAVTVTPGTAVVDVDPEEGRIYCHLLHGDRAEATAAHVEELAELACQALPVPDPSEVPS